MRKIYVTGSLRNPRIPYVGNVIRELGIEAFDDWFGAGKIADDSWKDYESTRGRNYGEALYGYAATNIFEFDKRHLDDSDACLLITPAGKSSHLELGYVIGRGRPGYVLFEDGLPPKDRWDVMYRLASKVFFSLDELVEYLRSK